MNFMSEWQEQYLTSERSERVRYYSCHENIKFISSRHRVISSISNLTKWCPTIAHFTVVSLATWPLNGSEAGGDLVLIQTSLLLLCKSTWSYANQLAFIWERQRGLYQSKVTSSLACIHGQVTKHTTVKWPIRCIRKYLCPSTRAHK